MPEQYRLIVSENYHRDIKNILHYIFHNLGSPSTALELLDEVENSLSSLSTLPYRFNLSDDAYLNSKGFRKCIVKNYVIFYKVFEDSKTVQIHRILHSQQNWLEIL